MPFYSGFSGPSTSFVSLLCRMQSIFTYILMDTFIFFSMNIWKMVHFLLGYLNCHHYCVEVFYTTWMQVLLELHKMCIMSLNLWLSISYSMTFVMKMFLIWSRSSLEWFSFVLSAFCLFHWRSVFLWKITMLLLYEFLYKLYLN